MLTDEISERTPVPAFAELDRIAEELSWLCGQINVLQARVVELTAQVDESGLLGATGCRSLSHWVSWKTGASAAAAHGIAVLARRRAELPKLTEAMAEGKVSLAQASVVASRVPTDAAVDEHFTELAQMMTVAQLRTAVRIACPPTPRDLPKPSRFTFHHDDHGQWVASIRADAATGAHIETGLRTHLDSLHHDHALAAEHADPGHDDVPPPTWLDALERMVDRSLERDAADRPWSQRTKVVVHVDASSDVARLHLGPALSPAGRSLLTCDGTLVTVLERDGKPVSVGRDHRITPPHTRLVIEDRDGGCVVPWCRRTRKLVTHHIVHWQHGGPTDSDNLVCLCPFHHRQVHAGALTISGRADPGGHLQITDRWGRTVTGASGASPPEQPPDLGDVRYQHPHGAPMHWKWYSPPPLPDVT